MGRAMVPPLSRTARVTVISVDRCSAADPSEEGLRFLRSVEIEFQKIASGFPSQRRPLYRDSPAIQPPRFHGTHDDRERSDESFEPRTDSQRCCHYY